jgi:hypothetical protein
MESMGAMFHLAVVAEFVADDADEWEILGRNRRR